MHVQRGITKTRLNNVLTGAFKVPVVYGGDVLFSNYQSHVEDAGSTHVCSVYPNGLYMIRQTHQNEQGVTLLFIGPIDLTDYKKLTVGWNMFKTCVSSYHSCGLTKDKDVTGMLSSQHFKDFKVGSVELGTIGVNGRVTATYDISSYDDSYYIWFECWASDNTSTGKQAELNVYSCILEA